VSFSFFTVFFQVYRVVFAHFSSYFIILTLFSGEFTPGILLFCLFNPHHFKMSNPHQPAEIDAAARLEVPDAPVNALAVPIAPFRENNPRSWFTQLESVFALRGITSKFTMFHHVAACLPPHIFDLVEHDASNPDPAEPYERFKEVILQKLGLSETERVTRLVGQAQLGDRKPSQLLLDMQRLAGDAGVSDSFLRELWLQRLPTEMRGILVANTSATLQQLADIADRIHDTYGKSSVHAVNSPAQDPNFLSQMAECMTAMTNALNALRMARSPSPSRSRSRPRSSSRRRQGTQPPSTSQRQATPDLCRFHRRFGMKARNCHPTCPLFSQQQGN
jgi:hypothetical protein